MNLDRFRYLAEDFRLKKESNFGISYLEINMIPKHLLNSAVLQDILLQEHEDFLDCSICGAEGTASLDYQYELVLPKTEVIVHAPAWVCTVCGEAYFKEAGLQAILRAKKAINNLAYEIVTVENGKITTRVFH